nr:hypothetical protein Itr_chr01CG11810 [Ipomoea trifida]
MIRAPIRNHWSTPPLLLRRRILVRTAVLCCGGGLFAPEVREEKRHAILVALSQENDAPKNVGKTKAPLIPRAVWMVSGAGGFNSIQEMSGRWLLEWKPWGHHRTTNL